MSFGHSVPDIDRVPVDMGAMASFTKESEFTSIAVSLMVETAQYSCIAAGTLGKEASWDRDLAAVGGTVVRQYKLLDAFLDQICKHRDETAVLVARPIFETTVNIRFFIKHFSKPLIDSYVEQSLRHERKTRDKIQANIAARGGLVLPIEDRMLSSLERAERAAGIPLDDVKTSDKRPWGNKNLFEKAKDVGLSDAYSAFFGGPSHNVHGNWQEIYSNHLSWHEPTNSFTPNMKWRRPRPQMVTSLALVIAETLKLYFGFIGGDEISAHFSPKLDDLQDRVLALVAAHEAYLARKKWPAI
ncbi:DUF5677 domain-containing protein [Bradyrhizobium sp. CIR3A]|uniref:DUF5677 domain-containing protein n=1 Tax=Bradyrhizobium sp. CIR3A TaxID=2663838 RepID=UPI001606D8C4|nr:DUF5677 domain-containing protein [Bradyrhizobium sp. CIR3A]MBB4257305.1 hypothetical protein [Bradyrhizobium sp. CIR3A]